MVSTAIVYGASACGAIKAEQSYTQETYITLINNSQSDTRATCFDYDKFDFDGVDKPGEAYSGQLIKAGGQARHRVEMRKRAKRCPWSMKLLFEGVCKSKCKDVIRLHHKHIYDSSEPANFEHKEAGGHHDIHPLFDHETHTITIKIENRVDYLINLLQQYVNKMKKLHQYQEAIDELQKKLDSAKAKESKYYREAVQRMIDNLEKNKKAYDLLTQARKLGVKQFEEALAKLREARSLAPDNDILEEISKEEEIRLKQKMEATAQDYLKEADDLEKEGNYEKAIERCADAQRYAQTSETMDKISEKRRKLQESKDMKHAEELQAEGNKAINENNFEGAREKFQLALNYTVDRKLRDSLQADIEKTYDIQATLFKEKAAAMVDEGNINGAIEVYEKALTFAKDIKLINSIKDEMQGIGDKMVEKLQKEGNDMIKQNNFTRGLDKLLLAKAYAKRSASIQSIENDIQTAYNKEAMKIQNEANNLVKAGKHEDADRLFDSALLMARDLQTSKSILLDKTNALKQHMELVLESGQQLANQNNFEAALAKYSEAEALAVNEEALMSIIKDKSNTLDKQNEALQKNTKELIRKNQFNEGKILLNEAMKHTADSVLVPSIIKYKTDISTKQTDFLQKEANKLANKNKFEEAIKLLDEALTVASNFERTESIHADKAKLLNKQGSYLFDETVDFESKHDVDEIKIAEQVKNNYAAVEKLYLEALKLNPSKEIRKNLTMVKYKIEGNRYMKEACQLFKAAKESETSGRLDEAQDKCKDAAKLYDQAEISFQLGAKSNNKLKASATNASKGKKATAAMLRILNSSRLETNKKMLQDQIKLANEKIQEEKRKKELLDAADVKETYQQVL